MISLLSRIFIKNRQDVEDPSVRQAYGVLCGAVGIGLNLLLFGFKAFVGILSASIAITADAFNNLSDAASSLVTLIGFRMSGQEPDHDHPFGHGRIEYLAGFVVSCLILLMALELLKTSVEKIIRPDELLFHPLIPVLLTVSILVKLYMYGYNRSVAGRIGSAAMKAAAADSISDVFATAVVLAAALIEHFTGAHIDGWCGILVGLFIGYSGICAARDTINPLLGQPPEQAFVDRIRKIALSDPDILDIHDLIVHNYGPGRTMISLHAEVNAAGDFLSLHDSVDAVERALQKQLHCNAVIHMDPVVTNDEKTLAMREKMSALLQEIDPVLRLHDFRLVPGSRRTKILFDVLTPYHFKMSDDALRALIEEKAKKIDPDCQTVVNVDKDMNS